MKVAFWLDPGFMARLGKGEARIVVADEHNDENYLSNLRAAIAGDAQAAHLIVERLQSWLGRSPVESLRRALCSWPPRARADGPPLGLFVQIIAVFFLDKLVDLVPAVAGWDRTTVERLRELATRWFLDRWKPLVSSVVRKYMFISDDVFRGWRPMAIPALHDEVVQDVFLELLARGKLAMWEPRRGACETWIWKITHNVTISMLRRNRLWPPGSEPAPALPPEPVLGGTGGALAEIEDSDLEKCLTELTDAEQKIFKLYYGLDESPAEIARKLEKQPNAIHQALSRIKKKIHEFFQR